ncbi:MAG: hypothetical protein NZT92_05525 [Abditibacteriales bacterium]|nr:hypothetical protein [Abditibacteriales bacterium]MDW8365579.1 hypothetical protein [Abditibacteriales bacterium]
MNPHHPQLGWHSVILCCLLSIVLIGLLYAVTVYARHALWFLLYPLLICLLLIAWGLALAYALRHF